MEMLMGLIIMAVLVEAVVEGIKGALGKWDYVSIILAAVLCPLANIDAFVLLGVPLNVPFLGAVLTGAIAGRGASVVYDVWERVKGHRNDPENGA